MRRQTDNGRAGLWPIRVNRLSGLTLATVALSLSASACYVDEKHDLPSDVVWTSAHFAYHTRSSEPSACEALLATLEQHFSSVQARFAIDWPAGRTIHYYKFTSREDFASNSPCPAGSAACTDRTQVYAYQAFEQHELVHAYFWPLGLPPPVIAEGTAVALVCSKPIPEAPSLSLADAMQVHDALSDQRVYDTGARLVQYLAEAYGAQSFLRFYPMLGLSASLGDLDRALRSVYGMGAEEIWAAALATPAHCSPSFACSREPLPLDGTLTEIVPTCGLSGGSRTFDLVADGEVAISGPTSLLVGRCDAVGFSPILGAGAGTGSPQTVVAPLAQGRYYVESRDLRPANLQVVAAAAPWAGDDCPGLEPLLLPAGQYPDLRVLVPPGTPTWIVRLHFEEPRELTVRWPSTTDLWVCSDCSQEHCQALRSSSRRWDVTWQGDTVLRVQGTAQDETTTLDMVGR